MQMGMIYIIQGIEIGEMGGQRIAREIIFTDLVGTL